MWMNAHLLGQAVPNRALKLRRCLPQLGRPPWASPPAGLHCPSRPVPSPSSTDFSHQDSPGESPTGLGAIPCLGSFFFFIFQFIFISQCINIQDLLQFPNCFCNSSKSRYFSNRHYLYSILSDTFFLGSSYFNPNCSRRKVLPKRLGVGNGGLSGQTPPPTDPPVSLMRATRFSHLV